MKLDLATISGIAIGAGLIGWSIILGGSPMLFLDLHAILIVIGGTIGATLMRNPMAQVIGCFKVAGQTFTTKIVEPNEMIDRIVTLANKARKDGILALEDEVIDDPFLAKAVGFCVDGMKEEDVKLVLMNEMRSTAMRHRRGQEILRGMAQAAPSFGMIGTLIGLVQMLSDMEDPSAIGPAMALALLATLYGAVMANVICLPMADKLKVRSEEEQLNMMLCIEGVMGLAQGINPKALDQQLSVFLASRGRKKPAGPEAVPSREAAA